MDPSTLSSSLDLVASACGQTLAVDHKAAVETSLALLKKENGFSKVVFWGRINGIGADYLIAQGYKLPYAMVGATSSPAVSFYSTNGTTWMKIADVAEADSARCAGITSPFSGDAGEKTAVLERAAPVVDGEEPAEVAEDEGEPAPEGFTKVYVTEETRLAYTIAAIDFAAAVVPKGAMIMDANENVVANRSFGGLEGADVDSPSAYCHFRPVANPKTQIKLGDAASPTVDVFETLADDIPTGCWSFQLSTTGGAMLLKQHLWPGFVGYAQMGGPSWGYCYFGNGLKNQDIAFML